MTGNGYRAPVNAGAPPPPQNYGNSYAAGNVAPSQQQQFYGQPQMPLYHQPIPGGYQQMAAPLPRPMNPSQSVDTRGYGQPTPQQMPMQNRSCVHRPSLTPVFPLLCSSFNDGSQFQQNFNRHGSGGANADQAPSSGGRWDAILADRQVGNYSAGNGNANPRGGGGGGYSGNFNNRNGRDNSGGGRFGGGQRENNYGRRDQEPHRPYHSHVGGQSGDATGADWNAPLPANPNLER